MAEAELKKSIKLSNDMNEDYVVQVDKYISILEYMKHMDVSHYKVVQLKNKLDVPKEVYDIVFYNDHKVVDKRKGVIKDGVIQVARNLKKQKHNFIYNFFFNLKLFSLT